MVVIPNCQRARVNTSIKPPVKKRETFLHKRYRLLITVRSQREQHLSQIHHNTPLKMKRAIRSVGSRWSVSRPACRRVTSSRSSVSSTDVEVVQFFVLLTCFVIGL